MPCIPCNCDCTWLYNKCKRNKDQNRIKSKVDSETHSSNPKAAASTATEMTRDGSAAHPKPPNPNTGRAAVTATASGYYHTQAPENTFSGPASSTVLSRQLREPTALNYPSAHTNSNAHLPSRPQPSVGSYSPTVQSTAARTVLSSSPAAAGAGGLLDGTEQSSPPDQDKDRLNLLMRSPPPQPSKTLRNNSPRVITPHGTFEIGTPLAAALEGSIADINASTPTQDAAAAKNEAENLELSVGDSNPKAKSPHKSHVRSLSGARAGIIFTSQVSDGPSARTTGNSLHPHSPASGRGTGKSFSNVFS